jgi:hypothetical protein
VGRAPGRRGAVGRVGGDICIRDIFTLKAIRAQDKIYVLEGNLRG